MRRAGVAAIPILAAPFVIVIVGAIVLLNGGAYVENLAGQVGIFSILVLGYNIVMGETGLFSLSTATIWGIGAYSFTLFLTHGWPWIPAVFATMVVGSLASLILGVLTIRLTEAYFAIATFALAEIVANLVGEVSFTGGQAGLSVPQVGSVNGVTGSFPLILLCLIVALIAHQLVRNSMFGRKLRCVREDDLAAASIGISVNATRVLALTVAGAFSALAGCLFALAIGYLDPSILTVDESIIILVMLVVGGTGSAIGAVIGAAVITLVPQFARPIDIWWQFIYGAVVLVAVVLFSSDGISGAARIGAKRLGALLLSFPNITKIWNLSLLRSSKQGLDVEPSAHMSGRVVQSTALRGREDREPQEIRAESLTKAFGGVIAVNSFTATFVPGQIYAIVGPNGSGKSTLMNLITGFYRPDSGSIYFGDTELSRLKPYRIARKGVVRTFQTVRPFAALSALDNLLPSFEIMGARRTNARSQAEEYLASFGIEVRSRQPVSALPLGDRRLLELARAMALRPRAILLDEPTAGLSGTQANLLVEYLKSLARDGSIVIVVEHNIKFVSTLASEVLVMNLGSLIVKGDPITVMNDPAVVSVYLGEPMIAQGGNRN